jgi:hypothetical protein
MPDMPHRPVETASGRRSPTSTTDRAIVGMFVGVALVVALVGALTLIGGDREPVAGGSPVPASSEDSSMETSRPTPRPTPEPNRPTPTVPAVEVNWAANPTGERLAIGEVITYECVPGGHPFPIWGTDVYTDDSSVCTAAVHFGLITLQSGGTVQIRIHPGEVEYLASTRHGIVSQAWPSWPRSYRFVVP